MSALRGNLKDFGIAEIFQLIGQQRKSAFLELSSGKKHVEIQFDRGAIVYAAPVGDFIGAALANMLVRCGYASEERAVVLRRKSSASAETVKGLAIESGLISKDDVEELEDLLTKETLFDSLRWSTGSFDFKPGEVEHDRAYERMMGAEQILMDGLRMTDEWQSIADAIPAEGTVFARACGAETGKALRLDPRISEQKAERVTLLIDGRASVRRVIDLSRIGTFDAMQVIVALREAGLIQAVTPPGVVRRAQLPLRRKQLRELLAALLPLLLLLGVSLGTFFRSNSASEWGMDGATSREPSLGFVIDQAVTERGTEVRRALEYGQVVYFLGDLRDELNTGRACADDSHPLAGQVHALFRPSRGVAPCAIEAVDALKVRRVARREDPD